MVGVCDLFVLFIYSILILKLNIMASVKTLFYLLSILAQPVIAQGFTLVTYNIEDNSAQRSQQIQRLLDSIAEHEPDVVLLQEASARTVVAIQQQAVLSRYQLFAHRLADHSPASGLMILVKPQQAVSGFSYRPIPSEMGRGILQLKLRIAGIWHQLINIHLESADLLGSGETYRRRQLKLLHDLAETAPHIIIAGDFNLATTATEGQLTATQLIDVWTTLHAGEQGATWEPKNNHVTKYFSWFLSPARLDRIWIKSVLTPQSIIRLNVDATPPLSDHYGLLMTMTTPEDSSVAARITSAIRIITI